MSKIDNEYMRRSFNSLVSQYDDTNINIGLWDSEKDLILKYFKYKNKILDMGCGVGRTTFGMHDLGYERVYPIDFSEQMIERANEIASENGLNIKFQVGNCLEIDYPDNFFHHAIFSFNGLMQIPEKARRLKALSEIRRCLKKGGIFIFTTHDRANGDKYYLQKWKDEEKLWKNNNQDKRLHDLGDVITYDENVEYFIHIPKYEDVCEMCKQEGFEIVDSFIRSHRYKESGKVYQFSDNCRFWVVRKV